MNTERMNDIAVSMFKYIAKLCALRHERVRGQR